MNSHDPNEKLGLAGFKAGITKFSSMAAAWFIGRETGTPFWTLFGVINEPNDCNVSIEKLNLKRKTTFFVLYSNIYANRIVQFYRDVIQSIVPDFMRARLK